ncbi:MAG TPA: RDD family protein [Vicinamibacterales bacterium]|nr:RDD family protein [Vicinamibacterales bacterium]
MKCPKCGYLGFEDVKRCRNCGYDFSLAAASGAAPDGVWVAGQQDDRELTLRPPASTPHPLDDLALLDAAIARPRVQRFSDAGPDLDRVFGASGETEPEAAAIASPLPGPSELPLSGSALALDPDQPLITRPSPPRAPLAVRRSTPEVPRIRAEPPRLATLDLESEPLPVPPPAIPSSALGRDVSTTFGIELGAGEDAEVGARGLAAAIDLLILAAIDIIVIYFTLQICGITMSEWNLLPRIPLLGFLLVQNVGYLVAFTAGGQTLGKMAAGIRVVCTDPESALDFGRAGLRTLVWIALAVPAGLGFLTAVMSRDHRGLHDRIAGTRVVR